MADESTPQDALARLRAEQEHFVHAVSHDLRAPLRHIISYGQLVQEQLAAAPPDAATAQAYTAVMVQSAQRMGQLIDGLVEWARLGQVPLSRVPLDMAELVAEVRQALAAQTAGRAIDWQVDAGAPPVQGDPALLRTVWTELLGNALKFGAQREALQVRIGWQRDGQACVFSVQDNGAGFNATQAGQLFQPFQRLHSAKQFAGLGLGLASCRKIVERHGGHIEAEGAVGAGCTVRFRLPL